jgi:ATP/ADP translocase/HEAT repeat protein
MLNRIKIFWRSLFDIREGELMRTACMSLYLLSLLFAYYILKPVSRAMFLSRLDIDKLPWLYILVAAVGGVIAYAYTKVAVKTSLVTAVNITIAFFVANLVLIWWALQFQFTWMYFVFNIWVSVFSIVSISQGWLIAANIYDARQAKRLYGILGVSAVLGAAFGGQFTKIAVEKLGPRNLLLASAVMILIAYGIFRILLLQKNISLARAKGVEAEEADFNFSDIVVGVRRYRHLQVIIGIIWLTYLVDVMVDYQFNAMAEKAYPTEAELTAFLGSFYGLYLNLVTFVLQLFLTAIVVRQFGVGGALQIMPVAISIASLVTFLTPNVISTSAARLTEAATRYTFNRTGMELLYLPLPAELKNRTKAFVDVFVDRFARGVGGILLIVLTTSLGMELHELSLVVIGLAGVWILLSMRARQEYIATVRNRLESRRLDLENMRISMRDPATVRLLEQTLESSMPRQAAYALTQLADLPGYGLEPKLKQLVESRHATLRAKVYELARARKYPDLLDRAYEEIRTTRPGAENEAVPPAVAYALTTSPDAPSLAQRLLDHPSYTVAAKALETIGEQPDLLPEIVTYEWLMAAARDRDPERRELAALAVRARGDQGTEVLHRLLHDQHAGVRKAAIASAGALQNRVYVEALIDSLASSRVRGAAIDALVNYGVRIAGTLSDVLNDERMPPSIRRQVPRVLRKIPHQRSVDVLIEAIGQRNLELRSAVLRGLNRLRESQPDLKYGPESVSKQILNEARSYYELAAALAPFKRQEKPSTAATLLVKTLEERLRLTIERLFRLLGLRYPPKQIYAAYLAVNRRKTEEFTTALEFLDNVLDRELKRVLLPLLDYDLSKGPASSAVHFGVIEKDVPTALRDLMHSGDEWLVSCAIATAAELNLRQLAPEIDRVSQSAGGQVAQVAAPALTVLA